MAASKSASRGVLTLAAAGALIVGLSACSGGDSDSTASGESGGDDLTTVGFVAVGPEGGWRDANEQAIKDAFSEDAGFDLKYAPAASPTDQKSQLDAFSTFVNDEVDVILLTATEASGWDDSLELAQEAEIPVILLDRGVDVERRPLRHAHRPRQREGRRHRSVTGPCRPSRRAPSYFTLEGVPGLSVVNERNEGFDQADRGQGRLGQDRRADRQLDR